MGDYFFNKIIYESDGEIGMIIKKKFSSETDLRRFESFYERNINKLSNRDIHGNPVDTKVFEQTSTELLRSSS